MKEVSGTRRYRVGRERGEDRNSMGSELRMGKRGCYCTLY